jgi:hypothetical protein
MNVGRSYDATNISVLLALWHLSLKSGRLPLWTFIDFMPIAEKPEK